MKKKSWYIAATRDGGCGHDHKTATAARKCLLAIRRRGGRGHVWRVWGTVGRLYCRQIKRESR